VADQSPPPPEGPEAPIPSADPVRPKRVIGARGRALGTVALAAVLVVSGVGLQRGVGEHLAPAASARDSRSGAWFCPHGGGEGWSGWIAITNPTDRAVRVRLTTLGSRGQVARSTFTVGGNRQAMRSVPVTQPEASTLVEYFGGWVAAGSIVRTGSSPAFTAAERCAAGPRRSWYVPDAPTARGETSYLVVMNPFAQDAAVDVAIRTDRRGEVRPGALSPYVVPAGTSVALGLNTYVLQAPDEQLVSGELQVRLGRVVMGGVTVSPSGLRAEVGVPSPAVRWILPAAKYRTPSTLALLNPGDRRADLEVVAQGRSFQKLVTGLDTISLGPGEIKSFGLGDLADAGVVVQATNGVPIVATRRSDGESGDAATSTGESDPARSWLVLPAIPPSGGGQLLVLQNPGRVAAPVTLFYVGRGGPIDRPSGDSVIVPAGRVVTVDTSSVSGGVPVSVIVSATEGTVVAGCASYSLDGNGYATTLGSPIPNGLRGLR
jgi:hypothetical protein